MIHDDILVDIVIVRVNELSGRVCIVLDCGGVDMAMQLFIFLLLVDFSYAVDLVVGGFGFIELVLFCFDSILALVAVEKLAQLELGT